MCANSEVSGETVQMRRLAWAYASRLRDKYHNLISWLISCTEATRTRKHTIRACDHAITKFKTKENRLSEDADI